MTKRRKIVLVLAAGCATLVLSFIMVQYLLFSIYGKEVASGEASRFRDIPRLGGALDALDTDGPIKYKVIEEDRVDRFLVRGSIKREALEAALNVWKDDMFVRHGVYSEPPDLIAQAMRDLDPGALEGWSAAYWVTNGNLEGDLGTTIAYDPKTGRFWGMMVRGRLAR
jgi:hypothetical protein